MMYELIALDNGDVLGRTDNHDTAVRALIEHVERNRATYPGIDQQLALIAVDDDGHRRGDFMMYSELVRDSEERGVSR